MVKSVTDCERSQGPQPPPPPPPCTHSHMHQTKPATHTPTLTHSHTISMASSAMLLFQPNLSNSLSFSSRISPLFKTHSTYSPATSITTTCPPLAVAASASASASNRALQALIFDCDGVILESEHLHRQAYNDAFAHFNVRCPSSSSAQPLNWTPEFYDELQNFIGGGKPKMRWFFFQF